MLRIIRYAAVALIAVLVLGSLAVGLGWLQSGSRVAPPAGGPVIAQFNLIDQKNRPVSDRDVVGRPSVMFFGFTYCPEVCPTTLTSLTALLGKMGADADRLGVFFVTVDPERDTPDALGKYLSQFDPRIRGLTGAAGFVDDLGTLQHRKQTGLSWRFKIGLTTLLACIAAWVLYDQIDVESVNVPWAGRYELGLAYLPIAVAAIVATTSAVAVSDGLDALTGGTTLIAFIAYGIIAFIQGQEFVATFAFTIAGANLGFVWYNAHPAMVFMGDTGALALGSSLAIIALMTGQWLLLPIIGIVFVIEALSNIVQIGYYRLSGGKRFFKRAPFHMHLELSGWAETQIVTRAWLISIAAAMLGVAFALAVPE